MPNRIEQPNKLQYINPAEFPENQIFVPASDVLRKEMQAWRARQKRALNERSPEMGQLTTAILVEFADIATSYMHIKKMKSGDTALDVPYIHSWTVHAASTLATTAFMRHALFESEPIALSNQEPDIGIHLSRETPPQSRIFIHERSLAKTVGIEPPLPTTSWYEFDDIYTDVTSPATDIADYGEKYAQSHGHPFNFAAYASFTPFLKQHVWYDGSGL